MSDSKRREEEGGSGGHYEPKCVCVCVVKDVVESCLISAQDQCHCFAAAACFMCTFLWDKLPVLTSLCPDQTSSLTHCSVFIGVFLLQVIHLTVWCKGEAAGGERRGGEM